MSSDVREINDCEVCGNQVLTPVLNLGTHPLCDDLVSVGDSRVCKEYPVDVHFCEVCRTGHHHFQVPKELLFPATYHYRSRVTADVLTGMSSLVDSCEQQFGAVRGKLVVDIGCNDGSLLTFFRNKGARTVGIEPTGACADAQQAGHAAYNEFLSEDLAARIVAAHGRPDIITFTNVFAHIEKLGGVLESLRILSGPQTVIVIENHYLGSILEHNQFDTFYHEHPRTYSYTSFRYIAQALGTSLAAVEFPSRYGGNIRVFLASSGQAGEGTVEAGILQREAQFPAMFQRMREAVGVWRVRKRAQLVALAAQHGKLRAKAFPARAAILMKLLEINEDIIEAVHEKSGSLKLGHYVPATRVPIVSDDVLLSIGDRTRPLINLAWHIPAEIRSYLLKAGYDGQVIDVVDRADFESPVASSSRSTS